MKFNIDKKQVEIGIPSIGIWVPYGGVISSHRIGICGIFTTRFDNIFHFIYTKK